MALQQSTHLRASPPSGALGAAIVVLLMTGGPAHIPGLVVPVIVDAVDAVELRGAASNVSQEVLEARPAGTDFDASTAIVRELLVPWIVAAVPQLGPSAVLRCFLSIGTLAMPSAGCPTSDTKFTAKAPTGSCLPRAQKVAQHHHLCTAVTSTDPLHLPASMSFSVRMKNSEATATLIRHVSGQHGPSHAKKMC